MLGREQQVMQDAGWAAQRLIVEPLERDEGVASDATVHVGNQHKRVGGFEVRAEERRVTLRSPWGWRNETSRNSLESVEWVL